MVSEERKARERSVDDLHDSIKGSISGNEPLGTPRMSDSGSIPFDAVDDTPPLVADEAREAIGESFAALTKATQPDDGLSKGPAKEQIMDATPAEAPIRPLSQIENDLLAAEAEFSDAEARRQQAEADARAALDGINKYQGEIDAAIDRLRQISPAGSNWSRQVDRASNVLTLKEEAPTTDGDPVLRPNFSYSAKN
jgi:hypothetical protein